MPLHAFSGLCKKISDKIGEEVFRSEAYLLEKGSMDRTVPPIQGEVKVAISIRMLAGGSYLDLVPLFDVSTSHLYILFGDFLDWVLVSFEFPLVKWLREERWDVFHHLANQFAEKSNGVFFGPIAALDGIAIRIQSPRKSEVPDPGNYYCRKGFYALNVQGICDKLKRFLWCYPSNKGSTHDHAAFSGSRLYDLLKEMMSSFEEKGLFIAGDTAYGLTPFLITPYDVKESRGDVDGAKDSFNFHLSSCRIYIECAFGEMVMRWGILWRTLRFELEKCTKVIRVCMLLHNYIIEMRESNDSEDAVFFRNFGVQMDSFQQEVTRQTGEMPRAVVADNNEPPRRGRPTIEEADMKGKGEAIRHRLTVLLASKDMRRPLQHDMHYNDYGNIYTTS